VNKTSLLTTRHYSRIFPETSLLFKTILNLISPTYIGDILIKTILGEKIGIKTSHLIYIVLKGSTTPIRYNMPDLIYPNQTWSHQQRPPGIECTFSLKFPWDKSFLVKQYFRIRDLKLLIRLFWSGLLTTRIFIKLDQDKEKDHWIVILAPLYKDHPFSQLMRGSIFKKAT
jgi:hypothetical protein